ncbi:MAG: hypothetical protein LKF47_01125 [Megasphaera sp.]|jgi:hypothetical protein|nr:hypothetical protein [Megasphaera sp.]MCI1247664.1 hypothetical protein [Megasphaera sp.]
MMDIRIFIGMPLRYAISVLQGENIPYVVERTMSRSHFFKCDPERSYVVRAREEGGAVHLLANYTLQLSETVAHVLKDGER